MYRIIHLLIIALLFACDSDVDVIPVDPLIGTWDQTSTTTVPVDEDPALFNNWTMIFGLEEAFTSIDCPYLTTNERSTWESFGDQHSNIILEDVEGGIGSFQISGFTDKVMTISFACIQPLDNRTQQNIIADSITPACTIDGNFVLEFAKR